ncbi:MULTISPECIES: hypothetical protein [unclassified Synechocystis]|nr:MULTISPECIES: hypothetical protein [unclassified Synechocystis]
MRSKDFIVAVASKSNDNKNIDLIFTKILLFKCLRATENGDRREGL